MKAYLQLIPIPMSGLMLGFVSLGNVFHTVEQHVLGHIAFFIGGFLLLMLLSKALFAWSSVLSEMQNPIIASVSPTFTMGTMAFSNGLHYYSVPELLIQSIWIIAAATQIFIILYFIKAFIWRKKLSISMIFPSWFILFVGTAMMPLTAGQLSNVFTKGILLFAVISFIILVPIVIKRGFILKDLPEPTIPMITILTAPASLSLAAYFQQYEGTLPIAITLFVVAQALFLLVLTKLVSALKLPFYPSYAAFTFPLVVTATATHAMYQFLSNHNIDLLWLNWVGNGQLILATLMISYVFIRYCNYLVFQFKQQRIKQQSNQEVIS
ncbi:MAG: TDT family transporter [Solibacillus sp.]|uniref:TDT family transporter n=1 Tax=unclassified Solibacillus TaxID=2637870 RepID=UPI0030F5A14B